MASAEKCEAGNGASEAGDVDEERRAAIEHDRLQQRLKINQWKVR